MGDVDQLIGEWLAARLAEMKASAAPPSPGAAENDTATEG